MPPTLPENAGHGLERSCKAPQQWVRTRGPVDGLEILRATLAGTAFEPHRHDTYGIGLTEHGVQRFTYRGSVETSIPGKVVVLHPDEVHDGRAGTGGSFGYLIVYVHPGRIADALEAIAGRATPLPFVRDAVASYPRLAKAISAAVRADLEPLAIDSAVSQLAEALAAESGATQLPRVRLDAVAVQRGRHFLDATQRVVRGEELERITGLNRYDFARQFRFRYGTSPYRYSLMRRLDHARDRLTAGAVIADAALAGGFADQAHFTRWFKAAYGMTPGRFAKLAAAPLGNSASN